MDTTFNQVVNAILKIFKDHLMIKGYDFGQDVYLLDTKQITMPYAYLQTQPSVLRKSAVTLVFNLIVFDKLKEDLSNEQEVLSDTLQIIQDILTRLDDDSLYTFQLNDWEGTFSVTPFSHGFRDDSVAGWLLPLKIEMAFPGNLCNIPFE